MFEKLAEESPEPQRTLLNKLSKCLNMLDNFVIVGNYPLDEQSYIQSFAVVGFVPEIKRCIECHFIESKDQEQASKNRFKEALTSLKSFPRHYDRKFADIVASLTWNILGHQEANVIGMISLHQTVESNKEFSVLWCHTSISRKSAEFLLFDVLTERFLAVIL